MEGATFFKWLSPLRPCGVPFSVYGEREAWITSLHPPQKGKKHEKIHVKSIEYGYCGSCDKQRKRARLDSSDLLLKTKELEQAVNGFAAGSNFVATNEDGSKTVRKATQADVEADGFGGLGLKEVVAAHDEALGDLTETVNDNSEALVKTAEVVNAISADVNANKAALEEQKEANEGFNMRLPAWMKISVLWKK